VVSTHPKHFLFNNQRLFSTSPFAGCLDLAPCKANCCVSRAGLIHLLTRSMVHITKLGNWEQPCLQWRHRVRLKPLVCLSHVTPCPVKASLPAHRVYFLTRITPPTCQIPMAKFHAYHTFCHQSVTYSSPIAEAQDGAVGESEGGGAVNDGPDSAAKPFLKRKSHKVVGSKIDWSHVKPRTVSRCKRVCVCVCV